MNEPSEVPYEFIGKVLFTQQQIQERVNELGAEITRDYQASSKLLLLGLLRGSVMLLSDLMRRIPLPMTMDFMSISSYSGTDTTGFVRIESDHKTNIRGWDVILVDDIIDTGYTIHTVRRLLEGRQPKSLKVCALLDKVERHRVELQIDYCGFRIPDYFVVGYGLDIDEMGRNLPYIASVDLGKYQKMLDRQKEG
jgi:hypoxanthine phosphoribosyltransferase